MLQIFSEDDSKEVSTIEEENFLKTSLPSKNAIHPALASLPVGRVPLRTLHESSASSENVQGKYSNLTTGISFVLVLKRYSQGKPPPFNSRKCSNLLLDVVRKLCSLLHQYVVIFIGV